MAVGLIPFIFLNGELDALHRHLVSPDQVWTTFVVGTAVTGVFGFLLGIANVLSIKVTIFWVKRLNRINATYR
jgi:GDP-fucose transporter C1